MSLATENTKRTSADFSRYFDFLTKEFGLKMISENYSIAGGDRYVRVYKNDFVQVEIAGDQSYFHAELRKLIKGEPQPYYDKDNNIGFESLAALVTNNKYYHSDYYPTSVGWDKVLENTADLFKKSKEVFTTGDWVDIGKIEKLKDEEFFEKYGFRPSENKNKPTFFGSIKKHAFTYLEKGYTLNLDSSILPPYSQTSLIEAILLGGPKGLVKISQQDWRDDYTTYYIAIDWRVMYKIDVSKYPELETAVRIFNEQLDKLLE